MIVLRQLLAVFLFALGVYLSVQLFMDIFTWTTLGLPDGSG